MTTCAEIMTGNPVFHEPFATVEEVAKTMRDYNIGPVPIVDGANTMHIVGIVTDRDLVVKALASDMDISRTPIQQVMTTKPITCKVDDDIERALDLMEKCQIRRLPIVDNEQRLVGIIAQADIACRLNEPDQTAEFVEQVSKEEKYKPLVNP